MGNRYESLIAKDDKPLSEKDAAKEEERIQKLIDKRKNESEERAQEAAGKGREGPRRWPQVRRVKSPTPTTSA